MTDTSNKLKNELSVLYPDITDIELNNAAINLINFYTTLLDIVSDFSENNQDLNNQT